MSQNKLPQTFVVATFYKFVHLSDCAALRSSLLRLGLRAQLKGTVLLAEEGINGTLAGNIEGIDQIRAWLSADPRFIGLEYKESATSIVPFHRMKAKLKKEIVTMGVDELNPVVKMGKSVGAAEWNALLRDPDVLVLDTRNTYEHEIGTFKGSVSPHTETFRQFPNFVRKHLDKTRHKKIAMFCTGGIRCEKASSFLLTEGFETVYQLSGGILRYLQDVKPEDNLWQGSCFVFDGRVAVEETLREGKYTQCFSCRRPITDEDKQSDFYQPGVSCHRCYALSSASQKQRFAERQKQILLADQRGEKHIGAVFPLREAADKSGSDQHLHQN